MSTKLVVDNHNELTELRTPDFPPQPRAVKIMAKLLSWFFHPLFIPVYITWFYVNTRPHLFAGFSLLENKLILPRALIIYTVFPLISVLLLKGLHFISSIQLKTQKERIIPYVICMIYYFGIWYFLKKEGQFPREYINFTGAVFFASIGGFLANIYLKISMHAIAIGVMVTFMFLLAFSISQNITIWFILSLLIAGLVCTSRFIASDHTQAEVYGGLIIGIASQMTAHALG
jgi:hypothetical protein